MKIIVREKLQAYVLFEVKDEERLLKLCGLIAGEDRVEAMQDTGLSIEEIVYDIIMEHSRNKSEVKFETMLTASDIEYISTPILVLDKNTLYAESKSCR